MKTSSQGIAPERGHQHTSDESERRLHGIALVSVLCGLMLTLLLEALDQTIVGTAMPRIIGQLHGLDRYTWAVSAYLLASTTLIPIAGKLSDQFGRKGFLVGGTVLFLLGSALCGVAQTINQLIAFRALQGAGAGIGIALVFTAVGDLFPPRERGKWQGVVNSVYAISAVIGPTLGGVLADHGPLLGTLVTDASRWRWVFFINLPLGLIALALLTYLPTSLSARGDVYTGWAALRRIDTTGALLATLATLSLLLGLTWGGEGAAARETPHVIGALIVAVLLYAVLLIVERRAVEPILPLDLFRQRVFAANAALSLLTLMALIGMAFYVPLFLQGVLGATATQSGATMTPFSISISVAGTAAGLAISALKRYQMVAIVGSLLMAAGVVLLARLTPATPLAQASAFAATAGLGMGTLFSVTTVVTLNVVPPAQLGAGMGVVRYLGQIGGAVGAAIVGTVVNLSLASEMGQHLPAAPLRRLASAGVTVSTDPQVLVSVTYRATLAHTVARAAAARVPPGPHHARLIAAATRQALHLLAQVFEALRLMLAVAIQHGLVAVLLICGAAFLAACFVTDAPKKRPWN